MEKDNRKKSVRIKNTSTGKNNNINKTSLHKSDKILGKTKKLKKLADFAKNPDPNYTNLEKMNKVILMQKPKVCTVKIERLEEDVYPNKTFETSEAFKFTSWDNMMLLELIIEEVFNELNQLKLNIEKFKLDCPRYDTFAETLFSQKKSLIAKFVSADDGTEKERLRHQLVS